MVKGESSKSAARNGINANTTGAGTIYELPWYAFLFTPDAHSEQVQGREIQTCLPR